MTNLTDEELQNRLAKRAEKVELTKNGVMVKLQSLGFTEEEILFILGLSQ